MPVQLILGAIDKVYAAIIERNKNRLQHLQNHEPTPDELQSVKIVLAQEFPTLSPRAQELLKREETVYPLPPGTSPAVKYLKSIEDVSSWELMFGPSTPKQTTRPIEQAITPVKGEEQPSQFAQWATYPPLTPEREAPPVQEPKAKEARPVEPGPLFTDPRTGKPASVSSLNRRTSRTRIPNAFEKFKDALEMHGYHIEEPGSYKEALGQLFDDYLKGLEDSSQ